MRPLASETEALFSAFTTCAKDSRGNDLKFSEDCAPTFSGKTILVEFRGISNVMIGSSSIEATLVNDTNYKIECGLKKVDTAEEAEALKLQLQELGVGDLITLRADDVSNHRSGGLETHTSLQACEFVERIGRSELPTLAGLRVRRTHWQIGVADGRRVAAKLKHTWL